MIHRNQSELACLLSVFSVRYVQMLMAQSELFETRTPPMEARPVELDVLSFLESFGEENSTAERCFRSHSRSSVLQGLPFGGVPTVLTINVVLWMVKSHTCTKSLLYAINSREVTVWKPFHSFQIQKYLLCRWDLHNRLIECMEGPDLSKVFSVPSYKQHQCYFSSPVCCPGEH